MKRTINKAIRKSTGEILDVSVLFETQKKGQLVRKQDKSSEGDDFCCYECGQDLETFTQNKNVFFRHKKGHTTCILNSLTNEEAIIFIHNTELKEQSQKNFKGKRSGEGERHYHLKMSIAKKLEKNNSTIEVQDEKVLKINGQIKRPDVYCKYKGKELVFEIQLSKLSARYMFSRYNFYKKNEIYLIWILDIEVDEQDQFAIDIKHLNKYQNFYSLDEEATKLQFLCKYKEVRINRKNELYEKWINKSIHLHELLFNSHIFQVYYYDIEKERANKEKERKRRIEQKKKEEYEAKLLREKQRQEKERKKREQELAEKKKRQELERRWREKWIETFQSEFQDMVL